MWLLRGLRRLWDVYVAFTGTYILWVYVAVTGLRRLWGVCGFYGVYVPVFGLHGCYGVYVPLFVAEITLRGSYGTCLSEDVTVTLYCPTLTKGRKWQSTQIWDFDVFRLDLEMFYFQSEFWAETLILLIFKSKRNDIASMSMYMHDRHILLIFEKCHFQELLPFVRVRKYNRRRESPSGFNRWIDHMQI